MILFFSAFTSVILAAVVTISEFFVVLFGEFFLPPFLVTWVNPSSFWLGWSSISFIVSVVGAVGTTLLLLQW